MSDPGSTSGASTGAPANFSRHDVDVDAPDAARGGHQEASFDRHTADRNLMVRLALLGSVLAVAALVIALGLGGGAPVASPPGIPDPGAFTGWGVPIAKLAADLAALATIGALLTPTLLLPTRHPELRGASVTVVHAVRWLALAWPVAVATYLVLTLSDLIAVPVTQLDSTELASFAWQVPEGRAIAVQAILALVVAFASRWILTVVEATTSAR